MFTFVESSLDVLYFRIRVSTQDFDHGRFVGSHSLNENENVNCLFILIAKPLGMSLAIECIYVT